MITTYLPLFHFRLDSTNAPEGSHHTTRGLFETWYKIIEAFCHRPLSCSSDVLPALADLATVLAANHHASYLNGIWKEDLKSGLLWAVRSRRKDVHPTSQVQDSVIRLSFCSSSWSWVSQCDENIRFESSKKGKQTNIFYNAKEGVATLGVDLGHDQSIMNMQRLVDDSLILCGRCIHLEISLG
jgi:hypothetical protein